MSTKNEMRADRWVRIAVASGAIIFGMLPGGWVCLSAAQAAAEVVAEIAHGALEDTGNGVPRLKVEREISTIDGDLTGGFTKVVWSSDGKKIAAFNSGGLSYSDAGNTISVWTVADGRLYRKITATPGWPFLGCCSPLAFVDQDQQLATPPTLDQSDIVLSVYDIDSGEIVRQVPGPPPQDHGRNAARAFAVSPDQSLLAAVAMTGPQPVFLYSVGSWGEPVAMGDAHASATRVAFSGNSRFLSWNQRSSDLALYDLLERRISQTIAAFDSLCCKFIDEIAFSPNSHLVAVSTPGMPGKWRTQTGEMQDVDLSRSVRVFRTEDGSPFAEFDEPIPKIRHLAWAPNGRALVFATGPDTVRVWDPAHSDDAGRTYSMRKTVFSVALSPDGSKLAIANGRYLTIMAFE